MGNYIKKFYALKINNEIIEVIVWNTIDALPVDALSSVCFGFYEKESKPELKNFNFYDKNTFIYGKIEIVELNVTEMG